MNLKEAKRLFRDEIDISLYVPLFQKTEIDLTYAIYEHEKMILVSGEAGSGKSFLIKRVYEKIKAKESNFKLYFIANPFEEEEIIDYLFTLDEVAEHKIVFIDEAQTLMEEKIERLRMLADNQQYTIILAIHEQEAQELFAKKHFKTRINYFIHLKPLNLDKIELFINSKLMQSGVYDVAALFSKSNYKLIFKLTKGNLREINRLVYRIFDILEYIQDHASSRFFLEKIDNRYIHMAQMSLNDVTYSYKELEKIYNRNIYIKIAIAGGIALSLGAIFVMNMINKDLKTPVSHKNIKLETKVQQPKVVVAKQSEKNITKPIVKPKSKPIPKPKSIKQKPVEKLFLKPMYPQLDIHKHKVIQHTKITHKLKEKKSKEINPPIKIVITQTPKTVEKLVALYTNAPQYSLAIKIAKSYLNKQNYNKSVEWAKKANKLSPEKYESWYIFAQSLIKLDSQKKAKEVLSAYLNTYGEDKHIEKLLRSIK